jgi:MFS family permease
MQTSGQDPPAAPPGETWRLGLLFGSISFLLGVGEPTDGLMAQPVASLLKTWGVGTADIAKFSALLLIPWWLKPLYGLLSDFVPLAGTRRKGYLIAASAATAAALFGLFAFGVPKGSRGLLLAWLLVPSVGVAFCDVAADGLMVETGQERGITGRLQAMQWAALYGSWLVIGPVGGLLCEAHRETWAFLLCGAGAVATLAISALGIRELDTGPSPMRKHAPGALARALRSRRLLGVAAFLVLWNFNPFSNAVLYVHLTRGLGFSEMFYGGTLTLAAVSAIAASFAYGLYCRRVPMPVLAQLSIALGVFSVLAYAAVTDGRSVMVVTAAVGAAHMTATLIQLDLAAQACPPEAAGTVFALLMALENLGISAGAWLGGAWYEAWAGRWGSRAAFRALVAAGAATTACCWLLVPLLPRGVFGGRGGPSEAETEPASS